MIYTQERPHSTQWIISPKNKLTLLFHKVDLILEGHQKWNCFSPTRLKWKTIRKGRYIPSQPNQNNSLFRTLYELPIWLSNGYPKQRLKWKQTRLNQNQQRSQITNGQAYTLVSLPNQKVTPIQEYDQV